MWPIAAGYSRVADPPLGPVSECQTSIWNLHILAGLMLIARECASGFGESWWHLGETAEVRVARIN